ncbi:MAG TPA: hypothetical protein VGK47_02885 [Nitrososphaeraceae archaeon]
MGSGKAETIKNFVKEYPADEIQQIVVDVDDKTDTQFEEANRITSNR